MDEQELIRRSAEGDLDAFEILIERKRERVFWIACHIVGNEELARDVAQEVFIRLFRVIRRFRAGGRFDAWLHRISANLSIDLLRRERPHREAATLDAIHEPISGPEGAAGPAAAPPGASSRGTRESPTDDALRRREVQRIFTVLSSLLTRKQRLAFVLREVEGLSTSEVAEIMKTRESTVRNHILQARRILQEEMRRRYPEYCRPGLKKKD